MNDPRNYDGFSYHNTTEVRGDTLTQYEEKAVNQETKILNYLIAGRRQTLDKSGYWDVSITPSWVVKHVFSDSIPITSARRAMSNLTKAGELTKTHMKTKGPYGRPEHQWRLADKYNQREMF